MTETAERKVEKLIKEFSRHHDLFKLADAYLAIEGILEKEEFPIDKYNQWLKQESRR